MKYVWLAAVLTCFSCSKESRHNPVPVAAPSDNQVESKPGVVTPDSGHSTGNTPVAADAAKAGGLQGCNDSVMPGSDHNLMVTMDKASGRYLIDFANSEDRALHVIALYVTAVEDAIPTFKNGFKFSGTPYWMVAVEQPFVTYFHLPLLYGTVSGIAVDVTKNYKGVEGGTKLAGLTEPACLKITLVTFEADQEQSFKSSLFQLAYKP